MVFPTEPDLVVVGCSWGGLAALNLVLRGLPDDVRVPIIVVQHRAAGTSGLVELLARSTHRAVSEANDKESIEEAHVYLAPSDYHLLVEPARMTLSTDEAVRYSRPSIDVTFESAADAYPSGVVGVVLTGANADGARGLAHIVRRGGRAIVQDPATAERREMPDAALAAVPSALVAPVAAIGGLLCSAAAGAGREG